MMKRITAKGAVPGWLHWLGRPIGDRMTDALILQSAICLWMLIDLIVTICRTTS